MRGLLNSSRADFLTLKKYIPPLQRHARPVLHHHGHLLNTLVTNVGNHIFDYIYLDIFPDPSIRVFRSTGLVVTSKLRGEKLLTTARFTFDLLPPLCVLFCFPARFVFSFHRMNKSISSVSDRGWERIDGSSAYSIPLPVSALEMIFIFYQWWKAVEEEDRRHRGVSLDTLNLSR